MRRQFLGVLPTLLMALFFLGSCASLQPFGRTVRKDKIPEEWELLERGWASFYGASFIGRKTANGETYDDSQLTAAHPTLPFGTLLLVRRTATGRYVIVRVNDRGPFVSGRVIDLSRAAAAKVGLLAAGVGRVELFVIPPHHSLISHL